MGKHANVATLQINWRKDYHSISDTFTYDKIINALRNKNSVLINSLDRITEGNIMK